MIVNSSKKILDYSSFLSKRALRRKPSPIRELLPLIKLPGMISLGGGNPNPSLFPLDKITITLKDQSIFDIKDLNLEESLQYSSSYGIPIFLEWLKKYQKEEHILNSNCNIPEWDICITTGSQDAMDKTFDLLLNEEDYIITENPTYSGALTALQPIGCSIIGIDIDEYGMIPSKLEKILSTWPFEKKTLKVIYTIPTGQNPSGSTSTLERKKEIYKIASKYNLLIIEDDPYYYLQLPPPSNIPIELQPLLKPIPSYLSMDTDGRVIRFDSFSKIISSGLRIGWVTGPKYLIERIQLHQQADVLHPSGVSQIILYSILHKWGKDGFEKQKLNIQHEYTKRRDIFISIIKKYLVGLAEWHIPSAGMFLWIKLLNVIDSNELIKEKAVNEKVLMVPGKSFSTNPNQPSPYVRASFSIATPEQMEEAIKRLSNLLKQYISK